MFWQFVGDVDVMEVFRKINKFVWMVTSSAIDLWFEFVGKNQS